LWQIHSQLPPRLPINLLLFTMFFITFLVFETSEVDVLEVSSQI
jgi:hypothetical protein